MPDVQEKGSLGSGKPPNRDLAFGGALFVVAAGIMLFLAVRFVSIGPAIEGMTP